MIQENGIKTSQIETYALMNCIMDKMLSKGHNTELGWLLVPGHGGLA
jgi:hypothetical protein